jgi:aminoglycoside phosphotransferase (APT) family kinase protein
MGDVGIAESSVDESQDFCFTRGDAESGQMWRDGSCRSLGHLSLAVVDWQLTTAGRPASDLARFLIGYLDTAARRRHENQLLDMYHSVLTECGVASYSMEQCWDDYRMVLVLAASRLATAVGFHPGLTATPNGSWNVVFPRYAQALADLGLAELLQQRYG